MHKIFIRRRKQCCLRLTVCHFHLQNYVIQLCQGKCSFTFYGTFKFCFCQYLVLFCELHYSFNINQTLVDVTFNLRNMQEAASIPVFSMDNGAGRHVSLRPPQIRLVYKTANLIGVDQWSSLFFSWEPH